jgi:flagellar biosynthesis protein FliQ
MYISSLEFSPRWVRIAKYRIHGNKTYSYLITIPSFTSVFFHRCFPITLYFSAALKLPTRLTISIANLSIALGIFADMSLLAVTISYFEKIMATMRVAAVLSPWLTTSLFMNLATFLTIRTTISSLSLSQ